MRPQLRPGVTSALPVGSFRAMNSVAAVDVSWAVHNCLRGDAADGSQIGFSMDVTELAITLAVTRAGPVSDGPKGYHPSGSTALTAGTARTGHSSRRGWDCVSGRWDSRWRVMSFELGSNRRYEQKP